MKATGKRIVDRYPHLQEGAARQHMLVRNAVGSARVEGISVDEKRLRSTVADSAMKSGAAHLR